ncbi:hypothetical protein E1A91_A09G145200v1 [Gossypium mustelinum]|uniref:Uncharacterized protein n=5 Tax=Gossypium TaxID=3633 RepID=A0A2P5YA67_GOSBA|nr:uncharacterized protein LOC108456089 [Gossypium arboreum]KAB2066197.1 hypothetical protein ES319_A09G143100v1 [Gossypium barbadense]TYH02738.1 hypothetical protein ES288_A09G164900v1 [Gossypium darwinii]TYI10710.1 hypothetical protein ES332_A09G160600v1 [Gossypium tomentosum]TYJ18761.1 hypothetical protein E1A91_A09G145200v1 [Gossypium mustelinum]KAK5804024.1 hypothetical protein PVK06_031673 [Gossypium arboreum]
MNAPSKLGIALIVIFATCLLALFLELVYVLWSKRRFRQRSIVSGGARSIDSEFSDSPFYSAAPSKELLYFFCWKNQPARVEPSSGVVSPSPTEAATAPDSEAAGTDDDDELAKWQALYGQSRVLYTITEEEREGNDSVENSADQSEAKTQKRACFSGGTESAGDVETPFSTPCASPPYFTPSPSPDRDIGVLIFSPGIDEVSSPENDVLSDGKLGFVSLRIEG